MRLVKYLFFTILTLLVALYIFMPKAKLYYKAESMLNKQGVIISNEEVIETIGSLKLMHPTIYYQGVETVRASVVTFKPYLVINSVVIEDIELLDVAKKFLNVSIAKLKANHTVAKPYYVKLSIDGSFGIATGYVDLKSRVLHLDIIEPKDLKPIQRFLKKGDKGWYYERKF